MAPMDDIQKLKARIKELEALAYKDELTGLLNRRGFHELAGRFLSEIAWGEKEQSDQRKSVFIKSFSVAMFDIDDFKKLNDTHGHSVGDRALQFVAEVVNDNVRDIDLAARWGGEEILLGLVGATEEDAYKVANRIREQIGAARLKVDGKEVHFTISGGVASCEKAKGIDELLELADRALYQAKKEQKNKIVKFADL